MASPQLQEIVQLLRSAPPLAPDAPVEELRASMAAWAQPPPADVTVDPVDAGGVPAEWVNAPGADADHVMLWLHGGGYCLGSLDTHRNLAGRLSAATGSFVLVADYRLAPEHCHPAAVDDAVEAYLWLLQNGADPTRMAVGGDSAGGGLAVALLLALRDRGEPLPGAAVCLSPWVDMACDADSYTSRADADPIVSQASIKRLAAYYLGPDGDPAAPYASPLRGDMSDLPPMLIHVGDAETLLDDARALAAEAEAAGVDVTLEVWDEMIHVWHAFEPLPESALAIERIGEFVRKHTA
ncbi:MAG: alpha/beta hydrolase [Actinomycetota bacterium]